MSNDLDDKIEIAVDCKIGKRLHFPHTFIAVIDTRKICHNALIYHALLALKVYIANSKLKFIF